MKKIILFLLSASYFGVAQTNLTSGLVACYALHGNAVEPISNLSGTLSSVSTTVGHLGAANTALYFSGSNSSYVQLPNNTLLKPNQMSFSAWVKASALYSNEAIVFTKNTQASYFTAYTIAIFNGKFVVCRQDANTDLLYSTTSVSLNTWYHIAFSMDISTAKIYVNGVLEGAMNLVSTSFNYDPTRYVILGGTNESTFNNYFNGSIENARFYNRILNSSEVSALYTEDSSCSETATGISKRETQMLGSFIYPNPAKESIKISGVNGLPFTYVVSDFLGKEIFVSGLQQEENSDYSIRDLPTGIYFITIKSENTGRTFKLIKE